MNPQRGQIILGGFLVGLGVLLLLGIFFQVNVWAIFWSSGLILLGVALLLRPRLAPAGTDVEFTLIGDTRLSGALQPGSREIWTGIGDVDLDFSQAVLPEGEITVRVYSLIGDVEIFLPAGVGVSVITSGLICELKHWGTSHSGFLRPLNYTSPEFASASRRVRVESVALISEVSIRQ